MAIDESGSLPPRRSRAQKAVPVDSAAKIDFRQLVENASVRVIVADLDMKIRYMNAASIETLRELQHLLPCDVDDIVALDDAQAVVVEIANLHFFSPSSSTDLATPAADMAVGQPE